MHLKYFPTIYAIRSLKGCVHENGDLTAKNISIAVVGKDKPFEYVKGQKLIDFLSAVQEGDENKMDTDA